MKGTELTVQGIPNQVKGSSTHEIPNQVNPPTPPPPCALPVHLYYERPWWDAGRDLCRVCNLDNSGIKV